MTAKEAMKTKKDLGEALEGQKDKIKFLKELLKNKNNSHLNKDIVRELVPLLTKKPLAEYHLVYDSFGEGLEPIYYWILDTMRDTGPSGLGLDVAKGVEEFEASASSGYLGEMGQRATQMQQKAAEYLGAINQVIKGIVQLLYDLREFELKIANYDDAVSDDASKKRNGINALKAIWMDQVDIKKGRGSINGLSTQDLGFITLRDGFFEVEDSTGINKDLDLNDRVKRILKMKLEDFETWRKYSEGEIKKRYHIERAYLKSQKGTLHLYASWLKPYLRTEAKLRGKHSKSPDIVSTFSTMENKLSLFGFKGVKPGAVSDKYAKIKLDNNYFSAVEVELNFRTVPQAVQGQGGRHYIHGGRVDIKFRGYALDEMEVEAIKSWEIQEDMKFLDEYISESLVEIEEEIDRYIAPVEEKKETEKPHTIKQKLKAANKSNPFNDTMKDLKEIFFPFKLPTIETRKKGDTQKSYVDEKLKKILKSASKDLPLKLYNLYKKNHDMPAI
jgi:hypothetical protein